MSWNSNSRSLVIKCNGSTYDCGAVSGDTLISKIQEIRRANNFEKFDVYDNTGTAINPAQVKAGEFEGDLTLVRFNKAA